MKNPTFSTVKSKYIILLLLLSVTTGTFLSAQDKTESVDTLRKSAVKIFIDCYYCDMNHIRREIPYVNYVRDVNEAQLYIRESRRTTGSGGREYTYFFSGQNEYEGLNDTLVYASRPDDTRDFIREGRTHMMKMGLMRYVARTPIYKEVSIGHKGNLEEEEVLDRWNNWVFEIETRPEFESEEARKEFAIRNSFQMNKITPEWKIEIELDHDFSRTKYIYDDETHIKDKVEVESENLIVNSLGAHWSVGLRMDFLTSTYSNIEFRANIFPSIEYNIYPYKESTHRQLRLLYGMGESINYYNHTTVFDKIRENRLQHQLQIAYRVQEKWGSINVALEGSNYLFDFKKNRLELDGSISIRVVKGLSFSIRGGIARIRDQLSLAKGELSEADILLQLQELESAYNVDGGMSLTYTFGSIFNNIVNPRFGNGRRYYR